MGHLACMQTSYWFLYCKTTEWAFTLGTFQSGQNLNLGHAVVVLGIASLA